ncbi:hypothetical protein [Sphingomicrobium flavum]|uniref:hypothetical protein n=1 Tax=Sphingomicrobium flavum TaxID=1229164 RepID=UPI0021AD8BCC|nr:hypothetical protein [Sphingomicrobium flavum]
MAVATLAATPATASSPDDARRAIAQIFGGSLAEGTWEIGPIAQGRNYSYNMPRYASEFGNGGFVFDFPYASKRAGHVHYVTTPVRSLAGARTISVRYTVDAPRGTRFVPQANPDQIGTVSLYFQRRGDNWSGQGRYLFYRWYAPAATVKQLAPGRFEMSVNLDDPRWVGVSGGRTAASYPRAFEDALRNAGRVGLVFGSQGLRGHGVFATAPSRFTVTDFVIR